MGKRAVIKRKRLSRDAEALRSGAPSASKRSAAQSLRVPPNKESLQEIFPEGTFQLNRGKTLRGNSECGIRIAESRPFK